MPPRSPPAWASSARGSRATTAARTWCSWACSRAASSSRPTCARAIDLPLAHRLPRRAQLRRRDRVQRRRADHAATSRSSIEGKDVLHRRGHRRHRPDHRATCSRTCAHARPALASRSARCCTSRRARSVEVADRLPRLHDRGRVRRRLRPRLRGALPQPALHRRAARTGRAGGDMNKRLQMLER